MGEDLLDSFGKTAGKAINGLIRNTPYLLGFMVLLAAGIGFLAAIKTPVENQNERLGILEFSYKVATLSGVFFLLHISSVASRIDERLANKK